MSKIPTYPKQARAIKPNSIMPGAPNASHALSRARGALKSGVIPELVAGTCARERKLFPCAQRESSRHYEPADEGLRASRARQTQLARALYRPRTPAQAFAIYIHI